MLQDCSRFQLFSCTLECVSGPGVESFLPGASGFWLLTLRAAPAHPKAAGGRGQPRGRHPLGRTEIGCCNACVKIARFLMETKWIANLKTLGAT